MEIGAQLFTIRAFTQNTHDFSDSLKRIADMGYKNVQVSGTCDYDPHWLAEELKKNDLRCVLTHIPLDRLAADPAKVAQEHTIFGCDHVGLGYFPFKEEGVTVEDFYEQVTPIAKSVTANGKYFMYHNHAHEFKKQNGKRIIEHIAEGFSPDILGITLDTYWVQVGGCDSADMLDMLSGRVPVIHLKDYAFGAKMAAIGDGSLNFDRIFASAEKAGTKYMLVEHDRFDNNEDPFDSLKRSYDFLKSRGF